MKKFKQDQACVSVTRLKNQNGFKDTDLKVSLELCRQDGYGQVYGDDAGNLPEYGLRYEDRKLVPITKIVMDDLRGQRFRASGNSAVEDIASSIKHDGWKLNELPPSVLYDRDTKEYRILEGRTRLGLFDKEFSISGNLIVDVYSHVDKTKNPGDFSFFLNTIQSPKGTATKFDAMTFLKSQVDGGILVFDTTIDRNQARVNFYKDLENMLGRIGVTMTEGDKRKFMNDVVDSKFKSGTVKYFNGGRSEVEEYAQKVLGLKDDKRYTYLYVSTDEWGSPLKEAVKLRTEMLEAGDNRKIRIVTFKAQLDPRGPVKDWYLANIRVGRKMEKRIVQAMQTYCPGATLENSTVEVYGTIPQCTELELKYPMDKLVKYKSITDKEYNLYGEK